MTVNCTLNADNRRNTFSQNSGFNKPTSLRLLDGELVNFWLAAAVVALAAPQAALQLLLAQLFLANQ